MNDVFKIRMLSPKCSHTKRSFNTCSLGFGESNKEGIMIRIGFWEVRDLGIWKAGEPTIISKCPVKSFQNKPTILLISMV